MPLKASYPIHGLALAILFALNTDHVFSNEQEEPKQVIVSKWWKKEDYPNPQQEPNDCKRNASVSWVCDPDGIMTKDEADELDDLLEEVRLNTSCTCDCESEEYGSLSDTGIHIAVALMKDQHSTKKHKNEMDKLKETEKFARFLHESGWDYGKCDNDAVIVVSMNYRKVWTSAGLRFTEKVSDWCVHHIYKEVRDTILNGNVSQGLHDMINKYRMVLNGQNTCEVGIRPGSIIFILAMVSFSLCAVISFISFFRQRFKGCGNSPERV